METLVVNLVGAVTPEVISGKDHLVAPMTIMVSGVLNGSLGPLFYPPEEILRTPVAWDGTPIVLNHPKVGGKYVLAKGDQFILSRFGMGFLRNTRGLESPVRLLSEGCFDISRTSRLDRTVLLALRGGTPLELSTGLEAVYSKAPEGATYNDRAFTHIARDYLPDHLAVLPRGTGACSLADGCGVLINSSGSLVVNESGLLDESSGEVTLLSPLLVVNPFSNEHSARVVEPSKYDRASFRRKQITPGISVIFAKRPGKEKMEIQAYRFDSSRFTASEARKWLRDHMVKTRAFEAASGQKKKGAPASKGTIRTETEVAKMPSSATQNESSLPHPSDADSSNAQAPATIWQRIGEALGIVSNEISHSDLKGRLSSLIKERFGPKMDRPGADYYSCYIEDVYEGYVVFHWGEELYSIGYLVGEKDEVSISEDEPAEVRLVTTYEPVAEPAANEGTSSLTQTAANLGEGGSLSPGQTVPNSGDNPMPLSASGKGEIIRTLLANCACETPWKGLNEAALNAVPDDKLDGWASMLKFLPPAPAAPSGSIPGSASGASPFVMGQDAQGNRYVLNQQTGALTWVSPPVGSGAPGQTPPPPPASQMVTPSGIPVAMPVRGSGPKTADELAAMLPVNEQHRWSQFINTREQRKTSLVDQLVANSNIDPMQKQKVADFFRAKELEELEMIAMVSAPMATETVPTFNFTGAVGGVPTLGPPVMEQPLDSPVYNFEKRKRAG